MNPVYQFNDSGNFTQTHNNALNSIRSNVYKTYDTLFDIPLLFRHSMSNITILLAGEEEEETKSPSSCKQT